MIRRLALIAIMVADGETRAKVVRDAKNKNKNKNEKKSIRLHELREIGRPRVRSPGSRPSQGRTTPNLTVARLL